jgi:hypothetical protein
MIAMERRVDRSGEYSGGVPPPTAGVVTLRNRKKPGDERRVVVAHVDQEDTRTALPLAESVTLEVAYCVLV